MSAFVLTVFPEGQMILSTEDHLSSEASKVIRAHFEEWRATPEGVAILADCRVQHATSVEIVLPVPA